MAQKLGITKDVPNVPCGVESGEAAANPRWEGMFLMYRVELKVNIGLFPFPRMDRFLMYRVELKVICVGRRMVA